MVEFTEAGFTLEDFKHLVRRQPMILSLSFQQNLLPKLLCLRGLGVEAGGDPLTEVEIRWLVVRASNVLSLSLANIESKLKYLVIDLQREGREDLAWPLYLHLSMKSRIVPRATYLQARGIDQHLFTLRHIFASSDDAFCKKMVTGEEDYIAFKHSMHSK